MDILSGDTMKGYIALVTGGSRGIGKGVALMLGKAGATVYISGRNIHQRSNEFGTLLDTANEIRSIGGQCIPVQCDHSKDEDVRRLYDRINVEQDGRLDVLVNCAFGGFEHLYYYAQAPFYEQPLDSWDKYNLVGLRSNYVASWFAAKMMSTRRKGLIVTISSMDAVWSSMGVLYSLCKEANNKLMVEMARELSTFNIACIPIWPGIARTELMMRHFEQDASKSASGNFSNFQTEFEDPTFTGKAIVALLNDPNIMQKSGRVQIVAELAMEYNFCDIGGKRPLSCRQLRYIVMQSYPLLAHFVPRFLYLPKWLLTLLTHKF